MPPRRFARWARYFWHCPKVPKRLAPNPAVPCGARNGRDQNKSPDGALTARSGLMVLVYDRPLLRSSARGDGALTSDSDRFAIGFTGTRMRASGLRCYWSEFDSKFVASSTAVFIAARSNSPSKAGARLTIIALAAPSRKRCEVSTYVVLGEEL